MNTHMHLKKLSSRVFISILLLPFITQGLAKEPSGSNATVAKQQAVEPDITSSISTQSTKLQCLKANKKKFWLAPFIPPSSIGEALPLDTCKLLKSKANLEENILCSLYRKRFYPTYMEVDDDKDKFEQQIGSGMSLDMCINAVTKADSGFVCAFNKHSKKFFVSTIEEFSKTIGDGTRTLEACLEKLE